jgi:hypothetical protein
MYVLEKDYRWAYTYLNIRMLNDHHIQAVFKKSLATN